MLSKLNEGDIMTTKAKDKICIVPTNSNLLITYARLYNSMTAEGKKLIEVELDKFGKSYDYLHTHANSKGGK